MSKRIIFTGGSGKAGREVVPYLKAQGHEVFNLDLVPLHCDGVNTLITDLRDSGQVFNAIGFRMGGNGAYRPSLGERVDAAFQLEANTWRRDTRLQLRLEDLRPASTE